MVNKAVVIVTLGNLNSTYDGSAKAASVITTPAGLAVSFTYNGSVSNPSAAGSYAVVATVSDTNYAGMASGTLIIRPNLTAYLDQYFTPAQRADANVSGPSANPTHDGMKNLLKYAFALPPTQVASATDWPAAGTNSGALTLTFVRRRDITDLIYTVEVSGDLLTWNSGAGYTQEVSATPLDAQRDQVVVRDLRPMSGSGLRFIRLKVTQP